MTNDIEFALHELVGTLASNKSIRAIGLSGGERPLPKPGEGDIDLFAYCAEIPTEKERQEMLASLQEEIEQVDIGRIENGHWGLGDCFLLAGVETWLLYFTLAGTYAELEAILDGQHLGRLDSYYYPIGRCAMWKTMQVFYDPDGISQSFKRQLHEYPQGLRLTVLNHHLKALDDVEDIERAVQRKDVLFFHFALDVALDHYLQALFALNKEYFPSRKRSEDYIKGFTIKPIRCQQRLRQVVALGGKAETLAQSYEIWKTLVGDMQSLAGNQCQERINSKCYGDPSGV